MKFQPSHPAHLLIAPAVWLAWLGAVYGGMSVACALAPPAPGEGALNWVNGSLLVLSAVTAAALIWTALACARSAQRSPTGKQLGEDRFMVRVAAWLYAAAAAATVLVGAPLVLLPTCV